MNVFTAANINWKNMKTVKQIFEAESWGPVTWLVSCFINYSLGNTDSKLVLILQLEFVIIVLVNFDVVFMDHGVIFENNRVEMWKEYFQAFLGSNFLSTALRP